MRIARHTIFINYKPDVFFELDIDSSFHSFTETLKMRERMLEQGVDVVPSHCLTVLWRTLARDSNKPQNPVSKRCAVKFPNRLFFSPNGRVYYCDCVREDKGVVGTFYPHVSVDEKMIDFIENRSVMTNKKCINCPYKFVCLGNCPLSSFVKDEEMTCGVFAKPELLDSFEFPYFPRRASGSSETTQSEAHRSIN